MSLTTSLTPELLRLLVRGGECAVDQLVKCCTSLAGVRSGIAAADLSSVLPEEVEEEVREAAEISMGTEVRD